MNTFDAIATIRRESLPRPEALKFLIEHFGFNSMYAEEIIAIIYGSEPEEEAATATGTHG